jgi:hypothetical protein
MPNVQPGVPTFFKPGTNVITWCLTDGTAAGFNRCCSFEVIVTNCPPVTSQCVPRIICPTDIRVQCEGTAGGIVFFPPPQVFDPCHLVIATNMTHTSGQFFPNGKTTVGICITWVDPATGKQNTECCSFDVIVRCCPTNCVPSIQCPPDMTIPCPDSAGFPLNYVVGVVNCGQQTTIVCNPPSGSIIFGATNVCCRLLSSTGIVLDQCCFKVNVSDTVPPVIVCPGNITVISSNCLPVQVALPIVTASDNCDPHPTVTCVSATPSAGGVFPCGVTTVTCTATDAAGNTSTCSFTVTVICDSSTEIRCPDDIIVRCAPAAGVPVTYSPVATNRCTNVIVTCNPPSGTVFPPGTWQVCCQARDGFGGVKECCFKVTVEMDDIPPVITCPSNIVVVSPNCVPVDVVYPSPIATDNCQLDSVVCNPPATFAFPIGTTVVTCCARDKAGNTNCCSFTVTVRCPSNDCVRIVCPTNIVNDCGGPNGGPVTYNAYAINTCTGGILPVTCSRPSGSFFPLGTTTVCCTNTIGTSVQWCCFDVTVRPDVIPPVITCPSNMVVISPNCTKMIVDYPNPTADDNCKLDSVVCTPPSGSSFAVGVNTVTCCAKDLAGNSSCCTFTITVRCPTDCVQIVCPSNIVVECAGPNGAPVVYNAYAINTCTGALLPVNCSRPSGSFFPPGLTTVCCTNNTGGVIQTCCFDVKVNRDTIPPIIVCPTNIYVLCSKPNGTRVNFKADATDNCDPAPVVTCVPPSNSLFPIGCTNVTCVARDNAGNTSTCTFKVCVLAQGCYLRNPSFEILNANLPPAANCGDPLAFAVGWSALSGTPDLFRPPWASFAPGNCRGVERPCEGTNYAGLEGGYTASGGFATEEMLGTLVAPLNNGQQFRLRACLSLAESSPGPVLVEFVLANSGNLAQQQVVHQVWVTQKVGWMQYLPPCFRVPTAGNWDRLIIRMAKVPAGANTYKTGYVYIDNVNICCCKPIMHDPTFDPNGGVVVTWEGAGRPQATGALSDGTEWHDLDTPIEMDPETGLYSTRVPRSPLHMFFRVVGPDNTIECSECSGGAAE